MCDVLSPSVRVERAAYCITQMTWTILNLLTWPSIWVSMGTSQTTRDIEEVHAKVFKPMINYIHRTFHAPHLNLTEQWMYTIENVFLGCLRKKKAVTCFNVFVVEPAALLQQFAATVCFLKILFSDSMGAWSSIYGALWAKTVDLFICFLC